MQINIKVFASWLCFFVSNYPKKKVSNIFAISLESVFFFVFLMQNTQIFYRGLVIVVVTC